MIRQDVTDYHKIKLHSISAIDAMILNHIIKPHNRLPAKRSSVLEKLSCMHRMLKTDIKLYFSLFLELMPISIVKIIIKVNFILRYLQSRGMQ